MKQLLSWVRAIFGEASIDCQVTSSVKSFGILSRILTMNTMCQKVLAIQHLPLSAEMAMPTQLRIVCCHFIAELEPLDVLADFHDNPARLVAGDYRHCRVEAAIMGVEVGSADSTRFDYIPVSFVPYT